MHISKEYELDNTDSIVSNSLRFYKQYDRGRQYGSYVLNRTGVGFLAESVRVNIAFVSQGGSHAWRE